MLMCRHATVFSLVFAVLSITMIYAYNKLMCVCIGMVWYVMYCNVTVMYCNVL